MAVVHKDGVMLDHPIRKLLQCVTTENLVRFLQVMESLEIHVEEHLKECMFSGIAKHCAIHNVNHVQGLIIINAQDVIQDTD